MALSTAAELKTSVQNWLDRSDYADVADDIILLAENNLNLVLKHRKMIASTTLTPVSGAVTLPDNFLYPQRVVAQSDVPRTLTQISDPEREYNVNEGGLPIHYRIEKNTLVTYPASNVDVTLSYYQEIPPLASNSTNWLLDKHPNIYLTACMLEAHRYFNNQDLYAREAQRFATMIDVLNGSGNTEDLYDASYQGNY
jgi:hypothetical protein